VSRTRARGFTLIEVLVALIIVALGMGAVMTALTSAAQNTIQLREKSFAEWVGLNQLSTVRLNRPLPVTGTSEGEIDFANSTWHWQQDVSDMEIPGLKRIVIQVRHAGDKVPKDLWLATVVGFRGDAVSTALGVMADWDNGQAPAIGGGAPGGAGAAPGGTGGLPGGTGSAPGGTGGGTGGGQPNPTGNPP
jgi:general secretion pathway protein I